MGAIRELAEHTARQAAGPAKHGSVSAMMGDLMLRAFLPRRLYRAIAAGRRIAAILVVQDEAAIKVVFSALAELLPKKCSLIDAGPNRNVNENDGLRAFAHGASTVAVCLSLDDVPPGLKQLSKGESIIVGGPTAAMVSRLIARICIGRAPRRLRAQDISHLPLDAICSCLVRGGRGRDVAEAILRLAEGSKASPPSSAVGLPDIADCFEYGPARDWALRIRRDLTAWQDGRLESELLQTRLLLHSEPGMGKTHFARILASSLGVPLIQLSIVEMMTGDGKLNTAIQHMREAFDQAAAVAPSVLLIDEIDVFSRRGSSDNNDLYVSSLVNALLILLDGVVASKPGIVVIGATNRLDRVDPAIRRAGRLSDTIGLGTPNRRGIQSILANMVPNLVEPELERLSLLMLGASPAEVAKRVKAAAANASSSSRAMTMEDIRTEILSGQDMSDSLRTRLAVHECGHALIAALLLKDHSIGSISLMAREHSWASVSMIRRNVLPNRGDLEDEITMLLAGHAAEGIVLGSPSIGSGGAAGSDLGRATGLATDMHLALGMRGALAYSRVEPGVMVPTASTKVEKDLRRLHARATTLLRANRRSLDVLVERLLAEHVLSEREVKEALMPVRRRWRRPLQGAHRALLDAFAALRPAMATAPRKISVGKLGSGRTAPSAIPRN